MPSKQSLKQRLGLHEVSNENPRLDPTARGWWTPPPTCHSVFEGLLTCELFWDVTTGSQMVGMDGAKAKCSIETFESLGSHADQGSKPNDIFTKMDQQMELNLFHDLCWVNHGKYVKDIRCGNLDVILWPNSDHVEGSKMHKWAITRYSSRFLISGYHNSAVKTPTALVSRKWSSSVRSYTWKALVWAIVFSWRPIREFAYCII